MISVFRIIAWTLIPTLELRASIPWGVSIEKMPWYWVFLVAVVANFLLGLILYPLMDLLMTLMRKVPLVHRLWEMYVERTRCRIHTGVERYGEWAVGVFIGIPFPGTESR